MLVESVVETFGPFLIPVAVFVAGVTGYGLLRALTRAGVFARDDENSDPPQ